MSTIKNFARTNNTEHKNLEAAKTAVKKEKQLGSRIDEDLFYELQRFALDNRTSVKKIVDEALREYLDKYKVQA